MDRFTKQILVLGAGRSASALIAYLLKQCQQNGWKLVVGDVYIDSIRHRLAGQSHVELIQLDADSHAVRQEAIQQSDFVISMLPPPFHHEVAAECLAAGKSMATASYVAPEIQELSADFAAKGLLFLGEMGLDPGIDHMSAMQEIHAIQANGGILTAFYSHTGGLVAPASDDNPWHYKISWNPRNVVLAGQSTAQFIVDGAYRFVPYNRMFVNPIPLNVPPYGEFEVYPNRDSLMYRELYGLPQIPTLMRGTIRKAGFCAGWDAIVRLGLQDPSHAIVHSSDLTYREWIDGYLPQGDESISIRTARFLDLKPDDPVMHQLEWLGLFSDQKIPVDNASPASILEDLIIRKWKLQPEDLDLIVMQHVFEYKLNGQNFRKTSSLAIVGEDSINTGMSKTVGLPLGIFAKLYLQGKIELAGVQIPVIPAIYVPVLAELEANGIHFVENEISI
ncbi:MAG: saccharopine dehydrogenase C-terminal domain-containing protein [Saprospiraceae bacterium]